MMSEQCAETYEPEPPLSHANWRLGTHTCSLEAGHLLPHRCPVCEGMWNEPGGDVIPIKADART